MRQKEQTMRQKEETLWPEWPEIFQEREKPLTIEISNLLPLVGPNHAFNAQKLSLVSPHEGRQSQAGMETACELVRTLLDQVSWNDSPPTNEERNMKKRIPKLEGHFSPQCHVQHLPPSPTSSSGVSATTEISPANLWQAQYNQRCKISEQKMGNVALAALYARTLEMVGKSSLPSKEAYGAPKTPSSAPKLEGPSKQKKKKSPKWKKLRRKTNQLKSPAKGAVFFDGAEGRDEADANYATLSDEREGTTNEGQEGEGQQVQLHMFGSEYARHLSTTALAPSDSKTRKSTLYSQLRQAGDIPKIEDADHAVMTGAITDIVITHGNEKPPKGFYRISQSASGAEFCFHDKKTPVHINIKKEPNWDRAAQRPCVTAVTLVFPDRQEFVPPGYSIVRRYSPDKNAEGEEADSSPNLNKGGEPVFLCFRRSREGNPITGLIPMQPKEGEHIPQGYTVLEKTPRDFVAGIQTPSSEVFLAYRQRLCNLELLRPLPLVLSMHNTVMKTRRLNCYYCTGGTVVESRVGNFHIMDRSTHSLLSPKSVGNRLSMIEASRKKTLNSLSEVPSSLDNTYQYSGGTPKRQQNTQEVVTSSLLVAAGLGTPGSMSMVSDLEKLSQGGEREPFNSPLVNSSVVSYSDSPAPVGINPNLSFWSAAEESTYSMGSVAQSLHSATAQDKALKRSLEALSFIPIVSSGGSDKDPGSLLQLQARAAILLPILTACYTRHGGSSYLAIEGLTSLLEEGFFSNDVKISRESSTRITLLDITIQVICDVAMMGTQQTHMQLCVDFVSMAVKNGSGHLNTRTVGYVLRFYTFVFHFGTSVPFGNWGLSAKPDRPLLDDPRTETISYLPGGAPHAAVLSIKDLISLSISRLRSLTMSDGGSKKKLPNFPFADHILDFNSFVGSLVDSVFDQSVHRVDSANYTQLALHQIQRAGGSELFWHDMINTCGKGLFGDDKLLSEETQHVYSICFALLTNCVKLASAPIRRDKNGNCVPRDLSSKLMSLETLQFFLQEWDAAQDSLFVDKSGSLGTFLYCVRRLIVPCLLSNTSESLRDPRVFRRTIKTLGTLLCSRTYRSHMKLEIGILFEHFVLRMLRIGPQILVKKSNGTPYLFAQQLELILQIKTWISSSPELVLEIFLNFDDVDHSKIFDFEGRMLDGVNWNLSHQLCGYLCDIAEACTEFLENQTLACKDMTAATNKPSNDMVQGISGITVARESAEKLRSSSILALTEISRCLATYAASSRGHRFQSLVDSWIVPEDETDTSSDAELSREAEILSSASSDVQIRPHFEYDDGDSSDSGTEDDSSEEKASDAENIIGYWKKRAESRKKDSGERLDLARLMKLTVAAAADGNYESKYVAKQNTERAEQTDHIRIAFDIAKKKSLKKAIDYLIACNTLTPSPRDIALFLRINRSEFDAADLGSYLAEAGSNTSETEHWKMIRFAYVRAISFAGMSIEQGLRHLLTNGGFKLPGEAQKIDRIISAFAECYWEDNAGDRHHCPFRDQETVYILSFAVIMLNTDLHKSKSANGVCIRPAALKKMSKPEFVSNLRGVLKDEDMKTKYFLKIYDSIAARPIVMQEVKSDNASRYYNVRAGLNDLLKNEKSADALLRGLAIHEYRFSTLEDYAHQLYDGSTKNAARDLTRNLLMKVWHFFHSLINTSLDVAYMDKKGIDLSIDLLKYMLSLTVCLELPTERKAFLSQLGRMRRLNKMKSFSSTFGHFGQFANNDRTDELYRDVETSNISSDKGKLQSLGQINQLMKSLSFDSGTEETKEMKAAVGQLKNAAFLLTDPSRTFVRQDDLIKQANSTGRRVEYRFFLFSDMLIYAKQIAKSPKFKVHEELPLVQMKVVDWFPPDTKDGQRRFDIFHPRKKVVVLCATREEKRLWVDAIRSAIDKEVKRQVTVEQARAASTNANN